jgi:hypothetical protein
VICTRNRAESLATTLGFLVADDRDGVDYEIVVVDNDSEDDTRKVADSFADRLSLRVLSETRHGKCHALNRALESARLGDIVAFLDDDMSPERGWCQGVLTTCEAWPDKDYFGGRSPLEWPPGPIPGWARGTKIRGWAFSTEDWGKVDREIALGDWPCPNNFWIRSRVLATGRRFASVWATEPEFIFRLAGDGSRGVRSGRVVARHRIQRRLLEEGPIRERAVLVGRSLAGVLLRPHQVTKQARLFRRHPLLTRGFCLAMIGLWSLRYVRARARRSTDTRFAETVWALERLSYFTEILRIARAVERERRVEDVAEGVP